MIMLVYEYQKTCKITNISCVVLIIISFNYDIFYVFVLPHNPWVQACRQSLLECCRVKKRTSALQQSDLSRKSLSAICHTPFTQSCVVIVSPKFSKNRQQRTGTQ